jgi:hypothetical protein
MKSIAVVLVAVALAGCAGVMPAELEVANAKQREAAEAIERDYQRLVDASTSEIARMGMVILDAEVERRWQSSAKDGKITIEQAKSIAQWAQGERDRIVAAQEEKRADLRASPNMEVLKEMNQALRDYLIQVGGAVREVEGLLKTGVK